MPADFTAALIAGGKSTRMGRDKAALVIDGTPLWQRQLATLRALEPAELLISGPLDGPWRDAGVEVVPDEPADLGPLGGLATVLARMKCERLLVLAVDLPAMTAGFLRGLLTRYPAEAGVVPVFDGRYEPLAAVYPRSLQTIATRSLASGDHSLQCFIRAGLGAHLLTVHPISVAERPLFRNVNLPEDLRSVPRAARP